MKRQGTVKDLRMVTKPPFPGNSIDFGSPRPNEGEGLGVRGIPVG